MHVNYFHGSRGDARSDFLEHEILRAREFQEREVFGRRTDENEIVVFGIVQGEQASSLDANLLAQLPKDLIQSVHGDHFSDSRVVVEDSCL